jgi:hypothetical protein
MLVFCSVLNAQNRNNIWCFGDSAAIDFNNIGNPTTLHSSVNSRGSCASISDTAGQLLFYSAYDADAYLNGGPPFYGGEVYNKNHNVMSNGDSIVMGLWYMEAVIVDNPSASNQYYLFTVGVTGNYGLYYSKIDMNLNNGLGAVIQKNVQLLPYAATDGLTCVKHGNSRDWWVIFRKNGYYAGWYDNRFYKYLVTPSGVNLVDSQAIGSLDLSGLTRYCFNKEGNKLASVNYNGQIETFDFDRCTGNLSNYKKVRNMTFGSPPDEMFSGEFSASGQYLYVATNGAYDSTFVIQIDLQNPLLYYAADTIGTISYPIAGGGFLKRGPDDKIYFACSWYDGSNFNFPYPDTTFNVYNTHLSVINSPNSMGTACNFTPFSFYLGGNRTYYGLPNNPDYDLPRLQGSSCDTVLWTSSPPAPKGGEIAELRTTYVGAWQKLFVNAQNIKGKNATLKVYDLNGRIVFSSTQKTQHPYFTQDVDVSKLSSGMYIVSLETESEVLNKKFVKQ